MAPNLPATRLITIGDCEADSIELMRCAGQAVAPFGDLNIHAATLGIS
jgi:hypothetical protein